MLYNLAVIVGLTLGVASQISNAQQPCLTKAWTAFNNQDYSNALNASNECIEDLSAHAQPDQKLLIDLRVPTSPVAPVTDAEKNAIFARGVLNDVGASLYIRGRSAEYLFRSTKQAKYLEIARSSYNGAVALPYARTWDTKGWFWSTAEASADRLQSLPAATVRTKR